MGYKTLIFFFFFLKKKNKFISIKTLGFHPTKCTKYPTFSKLRLRSRARGLPAGRLRALRLRHPAAIGGDPYPGDSFLCISAVETAGTFGVALCSFHFGSQFAWVFHCVCDIF